MGISPAILLHSAMGSEIGYRVPGSPAMVPHRAHPGSITPPRQESVPWAILRVLMESFRKPPYPPFSSTIPPLPALLSRRRHSWMVSSLFRGYFGLIL